VRVRGGNTYLVVPISQALPSALVAVQALVLRVNRGGVVPLMRLVAPLIVV
jgi:hypothetical protein